MKSTVKVYKLMVCLAVTLVAAASVSLFNTIPLRWYDFRQKDYYESKAD